MTFDPDDELRALDEDVIELGIQAQELFKTAAAALYQPTPASMSDVLQGEEACAARQMDLHHRTLNAIAQRLSNPAANVDALRRLIEAQQVATHFTEIARLGRQLAEQASALMGNAELELLRVSPTGPDLLLSLVRQTFIEVRGSVVVITLRDNAKARRLLSEDRELDQLYLLYKTLLDRAIATQPQSIVSWQRLLLVGYFLEEIGNHVAAICRALLFERQLAPYAPLGEFPPRDLL